MLKLTPSVVFESISDMTRKQKFVAALAVAAMVCVAGVGALSVVPHVHGGDLDHSKHSTCPVYQFSLHSFQGVFEVFCLIAVFCFVRILAKPRFIFQSFATDPIARLRSPPVSSTAFIS